MSRPALSFVHRYVAGSAPERPPLLLLHGTGGNEEDLLGLGPLVAPGSGLLSPRGQVLENGMPRFFRRFAEGVFDEADLRRRTQDLAAFITQAEEAYGLRAPVGFGFSNGANIAAALLMVFPQALAGAVLVRGMAPFAVPPNADLGGKPVLLLSGASDPIVPLDNARRLAADLARQGAVVEHRVLAGGHGLSQQDISLARAWIGRHTGEVDT